MLGVTDSKAPHNILYLGLEPSCVEVLANHPTIKLVGVSSIEQLKSCLLLNPFNLPFALLYASLHSKHGSYLLQKVLVFICNVSLKFTTGTTRRYSKYILILGNKNIRVFNCDDYHKLQAEIPSTVDLIVVNAWEMLPSHFLTFPKHGILNIHPSKLPQYRGALPTLWTLKNKDSESAVTYMILSPKADAGGVIKQYSFLVDTNIDYLSLETQIAGLIQQTLIETINDYLEGNLPTIAQDNLNSSYTSKYEDYQCIKPKTESAREIFNKVNLYPYIDPGTYCHLVIGTQKILIKRVFQTSCTSEQAAITTLSWPQLQIHTTDFIVYARLFVDIPISDTIKLIFRKR